MMFESFESDEFAELLEFAELDESDESDEWESDERARRGRRGAPQRRVPTAKRGNPVPKKAGAGFATKAELQATATRLDGRIATNSKAIQTIEGRLRALDTETGRIGATLKKEALLRKTETEALKKAIEQQRTTSLLIHLLAQPSKQTVGGVENVLVDNSSGIGAMLPILLMSGMGSGSGGMFGGDNNMLPLMAIAIARP